MDEMGAIDRDPMLVEAAGCEGDRERPPVIGSDERRMHVRAYNFWVSLLGERSFPSIDDLDPARAADFGSHAVLLDFTGGAEDPAVVYLGEALRRECGGDRPIRTIADVPPRSLLSRLTDHYLQILANRAPIGFEAEFVSQRGNNTLYRGILMPFSADDEGVDFVFGVINWKELAESDLASELVLEVSQALGEQPAIPHAPVWADAPSAALDVADEDAADDAADEIDEDPVPELGIEPELADRLAAARVLADHAQSVRLKSRAALYRALGLAYDFSLAAEARPEDYRELVADAGIKVQARAPMTAVVKLVFGARLDKARVTEFAAVISHAHRSALPPGGLPAHIESSAGGLKAMVAAERAARRPASAPPSHAELARAALLKIEPRAVLDIPSDGGEFVLLLARREESGRLAVLAPVPDESALVDRAIRKITR